MGQEFATPTRRVRLAFRDHDELEHAGEPVRGDLSAVAVRGSCLWIANDELATVERLVKRDGRSYGEHQPFHLADVFKLPEGAGGEMDIEGLDIDGEYLWIVGSHSLTRRKPKRDDHDPGDALERLSDVKHQPNRHFLGRVPLSGDGAEGMFDLGAVANGADGTVHRAAALKITRKRGKLDQLLQEDEHIGRFMGVPGKENGFDIEGLAVRGERVFLGLRGPVLRGWAIVLELALKEAKPGRLKPRKLGPDGRRYTKHFIDLGGLGIRELGFDGDALLILAGPTMDLDGPIKLFRWSGALEATEQKIVPRDELEELLFLPYGRDSDHAEGISWVTGKDGRRELLVVYDSPAPDRLHGKGTAVDADLFSLDDDSRRARRPRRAARVHAGTK